MNLSDQYLTVPRSPVLYCESFNALKLSRYDNYKIPIALNTDVMMAQIEALDSLSFSKLCFSKLII